VSGHVLPFWLTAPLGGGLMVLLAAHLLAMRAAGDRMPESRRRIRTVNGFVGLVTLPLTVYAFSIVTPAQPRPFLFAWLTVMALLGLTLLLAAIDMFNNARLSRLAARDMRAELIELRRRTDALQHEPNEPTHTPDLRLRRDDTDARNGPDQTRDDGGRA
jgi:hypothetical protein